MSVARAFLAAGLVLLASCGTSDDPPAMGLPPYDWPDGSVIVLPAGVTSTEAAAAADPVSTTQFVKPGPWKLGVSAGYLSNSWVVFALEHVLWQADQSPSIEPNVLVRDALFDPELQSQHIEEMIADGVDAILYWPASDTAILPALQAAVAAGIPTINIGGGLVAADGVTTNAYIDQYALGYAGAMVLAQDLEGEGRIVAMLPIEGHSASVAQAAALADVLDAYPDIDLLATGYGDWSRQKSRTITDDWLREFNDIDGVFSPAGQMSLGIVEAFERAGRDDDVIFSPGDEYNGWLKWLAEHPTRTSGVITFPPAAGARGVELAISILGGRETTRGVQVPSRYFTRESAVELADAEAPNDWWATELPDAFLPR